MTPALAPAPKKRRRSCILVSLILLLLSGCGLLLLAGGGYYAVQSGQLSLMQLEAELNGTGELSVINTTEGVLTVEILQLDPAAGEGAINETLQLESLDIGGQGGLPPGRYQIDFSSDVGAPADSNCILTMARSDVVQFLAVPEGIIIIQEGATQIKADDLDILTSTLCN